jgi:hypothetical protein
MPSRRIKVAVVGRLVANYGSEARLDRPDWPQLVGYGDHYPVTVAGRLLAFELMIGG